MNELWRFWREDTGTDLIEYAMLTAFVGVASAAALALLPAIVKAVYDGWNSGQEKIWDPCNPGVATTCH
jgi:Flp pilus assembly pilin Flp